MPRYRPDPPPSACRHRPIRALIALRCNRFHGSSGAQLCSSTSAPTVATQVSSSAPATASSSAATGLSAVTPVSRPPNASGSDGSSNCTTTGVSSRRASAARCAATPSASDAARSRSAPGSVIARWPLASSSSAASVIGPGRLHLDHAAGTAQARDLPGLFQGVHVLVEQADGPAGDRAGPGGDAVAARHRVDGHVDQQRARPAEHVGADSAGRQLDDVGQRIRQFADDNLGGLARGDAGPRSDAAGVAKGWAKTLTRQPYSTSHRRTVGRGCVPRGCAGRFEPEGCKCVADGEIGAAAAVVRRGAAGGGVHPGGGRRGGGRIRRRPPGWCRASMSTRSCWTSRGCARSPAPAST